MLFSKLAAGKMIPGKTTLYKKGGRNAHEKSFCKGAVNRQMRAECSPRVRPYAEFIGGLEVRMKRDEELWLWL